MHYAYDMMLTCLPPKNDETTNLLLYVQEPVQLRRGSFSRAPKTATIAVFGQPVMDPAEK